MEIEADDTKVFGCFYYATTFVCRHPSQNHDLMKSIVPIPEGIQIRHPEIADSVFSMSCNSWS